MVCGNAQSNALLDIDRKRQSVDFLHQFHYLQIYSLGGVESENPVPKFQELERCRIFFSMKNRLMCEDV